MQAVFIDSRIAADIEFLTRLGLAPEDLVITIGADADGLSQMVTALDGLAGLDAIHVISHGADGQLLLGMGVIDLSVLSSHQLDLMSIGQSLSDNGDLLLYGCNVAQTAAGQTFVQELARWTGADVAASVDLTGSTTQGADPDLEFRSAAVEASPLDIQGLVQPLAVTSSSGAAEIFAERGYYTVMAELSKAAYHLSPREDLHTGQNVENSDLPNGHGENFIKPYADDVWLEVGSYLQVLKGGQSGLGSVEGTTGIFGTDPWYIEPDGIYHCENAAAFAAKCGDAVFISIRGTNDNDDGIWQTSGDEANWFDMVGHKNELKPFFDKVDQYVADKGISKVYVTGHSLGGGIALAYMSEKSQAGPINYSSVTFAAPGYLASAVGNSFDPRIISIETDGDPVPDVKYHQGYVVSANVDGLVFTSPGENQGHAYGASLWHPFSGPDFHTMDLYLEVAKTFDLELPNTSDSSNYIHGFLPERFSAVDYGVDISMFGKEDLTNAATYSWANPGSSLAPHFLIGSEDDTKQ